VVPGVMGEAPRDLFSHWEKREDFLGGICAAVVPGGVLSRLTEGGSEGGAAAAGEGERLAGLGRCSGGGLPGEAEAAGDAGSSGAGDAGDAGDSGS